jgi:hypothetical protein
MHLPVTHAEFRKDITMTTDNLKKLVKDIVAKARLLSAKHTNEGNAPVNYACVFTQSQSEYQEVLDLARTLGSIADETATGPVFHIEPLHTDAGEVRLLKVRRPDPKRPERGDADFTVTNYQTFKGTYLGKPGFSLIERKDMEMMELIDPSFDVLAYYSHPTLAEVLKLRSKEVTG